jgi:hypothetical protein
VSALRARGGQRHARAILIAAAVVSSAATAPAQAAVFGPREPVGRFKVLSGHFRQEVAYIASYETTPSSQGECWTYRMNDKGAANYDLRFDRGEVSTLRYIQGQVSFKPGLLVSGPAARSYSSQVENLPGPSAGDRDCLPADWPAQDAGGCASRTLQAEPTALSLGLTKKGSPDASGLDGALSGLILRDDPFDPCPTVSAYSMFAAGGDSTKAATQLDAMKIGEKITLHGEERRDGPGPKGFNVPFEWVGGSQQVHVDWTLKLQRVKKPKG